MVTIGALRVECPQPSLKRNLVPPGPVMDGEAERDRDGKRDGNRRERGIDKRRGRPRHRGRGTG